jgi:hypothetical protein
MDYSTEFIEIINIIHKAQPLVSTPQLFFSTVALIITNRIHSGIIFVIRAPFSEEL